MYRAQMLPLAAGAACAIGLLTWVLADRLAPVGSAAPIRPPDDPTLPRDPLLVWAARQRLDTAQAVIDGRLGLLEAAARFHALNRLRPERLSRLRVGYPPTGSDEELACRQVIRTVHSVLSDQSEEEAMEAAGRLVAELDRILERNLVPPLPGRAGR